MVSMLGEPYTLSYESPIQYPKTMKLPGLSKKQYQICQTIIATTAAAHCKL